MLAKTALLIVSNPKQIGKILPSVQKQVKNTLYIQLLSALTEPFGNFYTNNFNTWPKYSQTIYRIYSQAATHCRDLDVRVLLSGVKYKDLTKIQTNSNIDLVIFDKLHNQSDIDNFMKAKIATVTKECNVLTLDSGDFDTIDDKPKDGIVHKHSVLGGTFDRLHVAHKLLLSEAALRSSSQVTVGITEENMLQSKLLWEMIQDIGIRVKHVTDFLTDICPELTYSVVPISDPFGPAITDPTMDMIVVSDETLKGGEKINEIRDSKKLKRLEVVPIELIDEPFPNAFEENKISSSTGRMRLLGTLLKPVDANPNIPNKPYVIGLTGGVASGKSGVAKWLSLHGVEIINCDLVGHDVYKMGKPCHKLLVDSFGPGILTAEGEIDRKALGAIVFKNPDDMKKLNSLVWPAIAEEVNTLIKASEKSVVVVEAAVLLTAGWDKFCHEVWTTLVPRDEAISRLKSRNGLTEELAVGRLNSQPSNKFNVNSAHVVFCPLWAEEYTKEQVDKAWSLLQSRLLL